MHSKKSRLVFLTALMVMGIILITPLAIAGQIQKVNINSATKEQLMTLSGVGEKVATGIIAYREKIEPFKKPEDIMKVKGIGIKTFEKNKDRITVKMPEMSLKRK
jgi:competence protein ComEA